MASQKLSEKSSTAEAARRAGVHRDTLLRWLRRGLVEEPDRDRNGWRSFGEEEIRTIIDFANTPRLAARGAKKDQDRSIKVLEGIDWDFQGAKTDYLTHRIHPYPAKFIPQIPNALIQELSSVGDTVGDIFCGSGTTLVEALTLKRNAVGIDANPLACMIARAKTGIIDGAEDEALSELERRAKDFGDGLRSHSNENDLFNGSHFVSEEWRPEFPKLYFWFEPHVVEELAELLQWCREVPTDPAKDISLTAFSSIVVAVSKQDSDTRYVRREKNIPPGETMRRFSRSLHQSRVAALELSDIVEPRFDRTIIDENLLAKPDIPLLDLVVSSPPYPNAYSYHLYHMTRMVWLGMDQPRFKREEIGSHRKYSNPSRNAATVETFRQEFEQIFRWLAPKIRSQGKACFVVGNSTMKKKVYDNADILSEAARPFGFKEIARIERTMQSTKKSFNPKIGKIKQEKILILERVEGTS